ncbi:hypothetical protein ACF1AO_34255 [Streptomyces longwoodensis]|uniref:hypothetical protein n=1 Tax=Streptomyces longwoodensis TaxID=68231 RepID=UPI0036FA9554
MTDGTPSVPAFPPHTPPPPPAGKNRNVAIIGSAAGVIAAIIGTGIYVVQATNDDDKSTTTSSSSTPDDVVTPAADEAAPEPSYAELAPTDFTMTLRTTERHCFGSAGCNVTVEPRLTYLGLTDDIDPDAVYEITYQIKGDESGPVIETAELSDRTSLNFTPSLIQTVSAGTKVSAEITDVTVQGM